MRLLSALVLAAAATLAGCAATVQRNPADVQTVPIPAVASKKLVLNVTGAPEAVNASDWNDFKREWLANFVEQTRPAGILFEMQEGPARPTGEAGTLLEVYVFSYRYVRPGNKAMFGIMTGNAHLRTRLTYRDLASGDTWGSQTADSSGSAMQGVFAPVTNKQVEAIAADVVRQMKVGAAR